MINRFSHSLMAVSLSMFLLGCAVGPDYEKPETKVPTNWKSADDTAPNASGDTQAVIEQAWWKNFNDPVLSQLIDKALTGNYDLKIAEARISEARAAHSSAFADLLPTGDAKGGATRAKLPGALAFPGLANPLDVYQAGFDASWELDLFGGHRRALEAAGYELDASEASFADARVSLLAEVARTYVDIRQYQLQLKTVSDTVAADQNTLAIAQQRAKAGTAPGLDATQAEALLEAAQSQVASYQSELAQTEYGMDVLLGEPPGATQSIIDNVGQIPAANKKLVLAAPAVVIDNRPDIKIAERKLAAATAQQAVATAQFYPDISVSGFLGLVNSNGGQLATNASRAWLMSGSVTWPILNYGKLDANQDAADATQKEAYATYQKSIIAALSDVEKSVTAYTQEEKFHASLAKSVENNRHASAIAMQRYKEGLTSYLEVLDADRTLYTSEIQLAQAEADTARDLIAVYKSLGGGWKPEASTISE